MPKAEGQGRNVIVVGASAGGVEALSKLVHGLPADLPAAIFVVLHVLPYGTSLLPSILTRSGPLPARHPVDGETIRLGQVYVAPPDTHLLINDEKIRLSRGPRENGHRPAVDSLFRSAARFHGRRVIGIILSGTLDDGTAGLTVVKRRGGLAIVQDPDDALYPSMPRSASESVAVDYSLPVAEIAGILDGLVRGPISAGVGDVLPSDRVDDLQIESDIEAFDLDAIESEPRPTDSTAFGCPDCGGSLRVVDDWDVVRFRCRVGHAWTAESLLAERSNGVETALWTALRALEDRASLCTRLAERLNKRGGESSARFRAQATEARHRAAILRNVLISGSTPISDIPPAAPLPDTPRRPDSPD